jgi:thiamine biosynthesis lipoprotein
MEKAQLTFKGDYWHGTFSAMASPCEILIETDDETLAIQLLSIAQDEVQRIEQKFSRYRSGNIIDQINHSKGKPISVDEETAQLLDYANLCYQLSEGLFDITSGVLRKIWRFDGQTPPPKPHMINDILQHMGWQKVQWNKPIITLPAGMEIDLGGIGKEYAVDRTALLFKEHLKENQTSFVINFGGDIYVSGKRKNGDCWRIGLENMGLENDNTPITIEQGGIATSGDTRRYTLHKGKRYGHILNPKTGWPVSGAPSTVTVIANNCMEAGMLATFAMLKGKHANSFLKQQHVDYYISLQTKSS